MNRDEFEKLIIGQPIYIVDGDPAIALSDLRELLKTHAIVPLEPDFIEVSRVLAIVQALTGEGLTIREGRDICKAAIGASEPPKPTEYKPDGSILKEVDDMVGYKGDGDE